MRRTIILAATALATLAPAASAAPLATIRVETLRRELVAQTPVGSARAYLDSAGAAHALAPNTALGQLVALGSALGVPTTIQYFAAYNEGLFEAFGSAHGGANGGWNFAVNGVPATIGADQTTLHRGDRVVWWMVTDFATQAAVEPLDLVVTADHHGRVVFTTRRWYAKGLAGALRGAAGAALLVNHKRYRVAANGRVTVTLRRGVVYTAQATAAGSIASQTITGRA
jgi:hypothetical protein